MGLFSKFFVKKRKVDNIIAAKEKVERIFQLNLDIHAHYASNSAVVDDKRGCEIVLFSKDRAMQLHALLSSYFHFVSNTAPIHVLYTCSSPAHQASYDELAEMFSSKSVNFIKEVGFKDQLITILGSIRTSKMLFMTDDALFIDAFDLEEFTRFDTRNTVPSLSKGYDLTYCFAFDKMQDLPDFLTLSDLSKTELAWHWKSASDSPDWAYPLSVDGSLFSTYEILQIIKATDFKAPNSLESNLQEYLPLFINRLGICYNKVKYVNVPCNIVQKEWVNNSTNAMDVELLLKKWNEGKRIYFEEFAGADVKIVQKAVYQFVDRLVNE